MEKSDLLWIISQVGRLKDNTATTVWATELNAKAMTGVLHKYGVKINVFQKVPTPGEKGLEDLVKHCNFSLQEQTFLCTLADIRMLLVDCLVSVTGEMSPTNSLTYLNSFQVDLLQGVAVPVVPPGATYQKPTVRTSVKNICNLFLRTPEQVYCG